MATELPENIDQLPSGKFRVRVERGGRVVTAAHDTLRGAIELRDAIKREIADGALIPSTGTSLRDIGRQFLSSRLMKRSYSTDESRWYQHVAESRIGRMAMADLSAVDARFWLDELAAKTIAYDPKRHGERPTKTLSVSTRKACLNLVRRAFDWAVKRGLAPTNPLIGVRVSDGAARSDDEDDEGYREGWYLDAADQLRLRKVWAETWGDAPKRMAEVLIAEVAWTTGLRQGELWSLHLEDLVVDGDSPHIFVRFGSWDRVKARYRTTKGKQSRKVDLWGPSLEAAKAWLRVLPHYAKKNPLGLAFPTERGARRDKKAPRAWAKVVEAFGVVPRVGRTIWWHLLRHTCASSLIAGWWGARWSLEDAQRVMGHKDIRTTQRYAHLAPSVLTQVAAEAHAAWAVKGPSRGGGGSGGGGTSVAFLNRRSRVRIAPSAPRKNKGETLPFTQVRDGVVTAIVGALRAIERRDFEGAALELEPALELLLASYDDAAESGGAS